MVNGTYHMNGYIRKTLQNGIVVDKCATDDDHMVAPAAEGDDRRRCMVYLDDIFSSFLNKKGKLTINIIFEGEE